MLRPEVRRRRIWLHDCSLCRVLYFTFIVGRGNPCAKKAATQTMFGCKKKAAFTDSMHVAVEDEGFYGSKRFLHSWCCIAFSTSVTVIAIVIVSG